MYTMQYRRTTPKPMWVDITTTYASLKEAKEQAQSSANFFGDKYRIRKNGKLVTTVLPEAA